MPASADASPQVRTPTPSEIARRVNHLVARVQSQYGLALDVVDTVDARTLERGAAILDDLTEVVMATLEGAEGTRRGELGKVLVEVLDARRHLRVTRAATRAKPLIELTQAMNRLTTVETVAGLRKEACREAARACGLERVILSVVTDGKWTAVDTHADSGQPLELDKLADVPLDRCRAERTAAESGATVVAANDCVEPTDEVVAVLRRNRYLVAPVLASGRLIGLFHADNRPGGRPVDRADAEVLTAFVAGFTAILERAVLAEHIEEQRRAIQDLLRREAEEAERIFDAELTLSGDDDSSRRIERYARLPDVNASVLDELTSRERDVLSHLVRGASNAEIADRLVITIATVKSHVKKILRKLAVVNRAEAISRYRELTGPR